MRKAILALLCVGLLGSSLFGCSKKEENTDAAPGVTEADKSATGPTGNKGAQATGAPQVGLNPDYKGPAVGSKASGNGGH